MAFTDTEKVSIRRHLGYNSAAESNHPWITTFRAVSQVLDSTPAETEAEARALLGRLDDIETRLSGALGRLKAIKVGTIELRPSETRELRRELSVWRRELSVLLGVPIQFRAGAQITVV